MNKFKILVVLILCFAFYKGFVVIKDFEIGVDSRVAKIEQAAGLEKQDAGLEKQDEVIGLMMYLGNPPVMKEHLLMHSSEDCLIKKEIAELTSGAIYKCLKVDAVIKNKKIVSIIKEIEVIK